MTTSSLEIAVLGLLKEGPMHGYEIKRRLATNLGPLWSISFGSLYPCLKRLGKQGYVNEQESEGTRSRRRTPYEITPTGEAYFYDQLEHGAVYDTDRFRLRLAYFKYLPSDARIGLMERRKAYLMERLSEFGETLKSAEEKIDQWSMQLIRHQTEATEQDIRWLQELIDQERAASSGRKTRRRKTNG